MKGGYSEIDITLKLPLFPRKAIIRILKTIDQDLCYNRLMNKSDFYQPVEQAGFRKYFSTKETYPSSGH